MRNPYGIDKTFVIFRIIIGKYVYNNSLFTLIQIKRYFEFCFHNKSVREFI